jgi:DNA mismatch repair protein MutL
MRDVIKLLPDAIANQIAAGEVIQRPASVVKELMENAVDAGSKQIKLIVKDAGRTLVQVIDDGCGMSETDARMAFERHATSKIREANDLFALRTMGFRGEALASMAAVAQVELRTRRHQAEMGTSIQIEASVIKAQEPCQTAAGSSFSVKNLFYNVPARRNFLKGNNVEFRHIIDEFQRVALANPDIHFTLNHNGSEVFHLPPGNLRQRALGIFGNAFNNRLVPLHEETDVLKIRGFIGKPEFAKKSRGEQFFFVNDRFIRSTYLNHAVMVAYEEVLPKESFPFYLIFMDLDPAHIDVNVHPTKTEIKFDDERLVYNYVRVAVRHALGQYGVMPSLDFDRENTFNLPYITTERDRDKPIETPPRTSNRPPDWAQTPSWKDDSSDQKRESNNLRHWQDLYQGLGDEEPRFETLSSAANDDDPEDGITVSSSSETLVFQSSWSTEEDSSPVSPAGLTENASNKKAPYQLHSQFIVSQIKSGFMLIDQQAAHERILYEQFLHKLSDQQPAVQGMLFPSMMDFSPQEATVLRALLPELQAMGFDLQEFGVNSFALNALPAELAGRVSERAIIEELLEQHTIGVELQLNTRETIARAMAQSAATRRGQLLNESEMQALIDQLFACSLPFRSPFGRRCFITLELEDLLKQFSA